MYLDGKGTMQHTERLCAAAWGALPRAWGGIALTVAGPVLWWATFIHRFSWEPPATVLEVKVAWIASAALVAFGVWLALPWFKALRTLNIHTRKMAAETEARGRGWASS